MLVIVNYGVGNLGSIFNMLKKIGKPAVITSNPEDISKADKIVLPGIGAFDYCMKELNASGLRPIIEKKVFESNTPILGVCVGCQMLMADSEEGNEPGLGWLKGKVIGFRKDRMLPGNKIPHMSWTDIQPLPDALLYEKIETPRFYFVHSYHIETDDKSIVTATAEYGYRFVASVGKEHIQGVQFHPEKSHRFGMQLYANFANNF